LEDLLDPLDQEVHRERSGQTVFIILVSERQIDHDAVVVIAQTHSDQLVDGVLGSVQIGILVLNCKQQIIALSNVCNVNNTIILEQKIVDFSLVATSHLQP
jgi:hypothetical protein